MRNWPWWRRGEGASLPPLEWELWQTLVNSPVSWAVLGWGGRHAGHGLVRKGLAYSEGGWLRKVET